MIMARLVVQEVVSTGRVTEVAVPVQDFRATKPGTSIKGTKVTRRLQPSGESAAAAVGLSEQSQAAK